MKLLLSLVVLCISASVFSQQYSKVKIYTDYEGLSRLAAAGVPVDHAITEKANNIKLNTAHLSQGIYTVRIKCNGGLTQPIKLAIVK